MQKTCRSSQQMQAVNNRQQKPGQVGPNNQNPLVCSKGQHHMELRLNVLYLITGCEFKIRITFKRVFVLGKLSAFLQIDFQPVFGHASVKYASMWIIGEVVDVLLISIERVTEQE